MSHDDQRDDRPAVIPCQAADIPRYRARRTPVRPPLDARLEAPCWRDAERSPRFRDLVSGARCCHDTRAAVLWDDDCLYVGYWIEEPDVRAIFTERDSPIYEDNDVELFIAGDAGYYELEINAFGTLYEVFFLWEDRYVSGGFDQRAEFARDAPGARPWDGVGLRHPRGKRIGFWEWDYPGLKSAVWIDGSINDERVRDRGWRVELALPWQGLSHLADGRTLPPTPGDVWRMDFSRFNRYREAPPASDSGGWAWHPHGVWDSHVPECFVAIEFVE